MEGSSVAFRNLTAFGDDAAREIIIVELIIGLRLTFTFVNVGSERETCATIVRRWDRRDRSHERWTEEADARVARFVAETMRTWTPRPRYPLRRKSRTRTSPG